MRIEASALHHWMTHFYGYGSWQANFWFIGYEESGGDLPEEVAEKFQYFTSTHPSVKEPTLCDIRELYKHIAFRIEGPRAAKFSTFHDHRFGKHAVQHGFWKNLSAFAFGYQQKKVPDLLAYQQQAFAAPGSQEALLHLYPLPAHNHAWYYSWLDLPQFPYLKSRALYEQHVYPSRIACILQNITVYKPELVLLYGMNNIKALKASIQEFFPGVTFKTVKAVKQKIPSYHHATVHNTTLLLTTHVPGLRHNRIETGFDWELFGKSIQLST